MISRLNRKRLVRLALMRTHTFRTWKVDDKDEHGSNGASTNFIKLTENWGFKFLRWGNKSQTAQVFVRQRRAWRRQLGPFCFGLVRFRAANNDILFGYFVEIVTPLKDGTEMANCIEEGDGKLGKQVKDMRRHFKKFNFHFYDNHEANMAYRGNNKKLLCIDYDC